MAGSAWSATAPHRILTSQVGSPGSNGVGVDHIDAPGAHSGLGPRTRRAEPNSQSRVGNGSLFRFQAETFEKPLTQVQCPI